MKKFILPFLILTSSCSPSICPELTFDSANVITYDSNENYLQEDVQHMKMILLEVFNNT